MTVEFFFIINRTRFTFQRESIKNETRFSYRIRAQGQKAKQAIFSKSEYTCELHNEVERK